MYFPGYHKNYGSEIDAYGNCRPWPSSRAAFVGAHERSPGIGRVMLSRALHGPSDAALLTIANRDPGPGIPGTGPPVADPYSGRLQFEPGILQFQPGVLPPPEEEEKSHTGLIVFGVLAATALGIFILTR